MKRDMDKVRSIMLALEADPNPYYLTMDPRLIGGIDDASEMVEYLQLLASGGLLEVPQRSTYRITWAGHEFIEKVRDEEIWRKTKEGATKTGIWTFKLIGDLASAAIKARVSQTLGIDFD